MKDFTGLELCDCRRKDVDIHVRASLVNGELTISGQDLGPFVEDVWGDSDYEYWYFLDKENTEKLLAAIHGETDLEAALLREFSGEDGCRKFRRICRKNKIAYGFHSYV